MLSTLALLGGFTTWIGLVTALGAALLAPRAGAAGLGTVVLAAVGALMMAGAWRVWRHPGTRLAASIGGREAHARPTAANAAAMWPDGLDGAAVLDAARCRFLRLQAAWDEGDVQALGHLTTPDMLEELLPVLTGRGSVPNRTDVITLHAELLGLEEVSATYLASVEFSGLIRESAGQAAVPFRELWMLACTKDGSPSWRLARQQALF
ncbi:MAG: Tim44-like domain-containing protein [Caldimonas sp.]